MSEVVSSINLNPQLVTDDKSVTSLHDVDDLKVTPHTDIGNSRVTSVAHLVLNYDPEAMIWQDSPSPSLMLPSLLKWALIIAIWVVALIVLRPAPVGGAPVAPTPTVQETVEAQTQKGKRAKSNHKTEVSQTSAKAAPVKPEPARQSSTDDTAYTWTLYIGLLVLAFQLFSHGEWYLRLKNISYKMSSQRLAIESGIFSKAVNTYELHQLENGQVYKPWNLRLFGRENLYISGLWLTGIKNAEAVRDLIRNAGQIEASRIEKARFR